MSSVVTVEEKVVQAPEEAPERRLSLDEIQSWGKQPAFQLSMLALGALVFAFFPFMRLVWRQWTDMDSYYAHGLLVPLCSAYLIWMRWPQIKEIPVKSQPLFLVPLLPTLVIAALSMRLEQPLLQSVLFIAALWFSIGFVGGWRWAWARFLPVAFLVLAFPILDRVIDKVTLPLQMMSTSVAYEMLKVVGYDVIRSESTTIEMSRWTLFVAAACSGLKTTISVTAAVLFFMIIARLKWHANLILATIAIPLSVVINGLRIAMIGAVGNEYGDKAGMQFHDYSGYIALVICFLILGMLTKWLGYKG